jgi:molecular chaperone HtpG
VIKHLLSLKNQGLDEEKMSPWIEVLYDTALLSEGSPIKDPSHFAKNLNVIMEKAARQ